MTLLMHRFEYGRLGILLRLVAENLLCLSLPIPQMT